MPVSNYQRKKDNFEAIQYDGRNLNEIKTWLGPDYPTRIVTGESEQAGAWMRQTPYESATWYKLEASYWVVKVMGGENVEFFHDPDFTRFFEPYV